MLWNQQQYGIMGSRQHSPYVAFRMARNLVSFSLWEFHGHSRIFILLFALLVCSLITSHLALCREYWVKEGVVTGGQYGSSQGCQQYLIPHCSHHEPGPYPNCSGGSHTPKCTETCEEGYPKTYEQDKHYGKTAYNVRGVEEIMTEIMTNGPVEGVFTVYSDFPTYKSG